jgi:hypothetical protein
VGNKSLRAVAAVGFTAGLALIVAPAANASGSVHSATANARDHVISHTRSAQQSSNWSGYAETGSYSSATATWNVPTVTTGSGSQYSSDWVGIDGYNNSNLIQTGTEQDNINGTAEYQAWWEILPAAETPISSLTIHPGDSITGSLTKSSSTWTIKLTDNTTGKSYSTSKSYSGPADSVEYIQEAPEVNGSIAKPADISTVTFSGLTENGSNPNLTSSDAIDLVQNGTTYYTPSAPSGGNSFSDSYTG